jgi:acyl carrier protein
MEKRLLDLFNEMIEENNGQKLESLNPDLSLRNDLHFDSLLLAELTVKIEDEFEVDIFENGIIDTLAEVISVIKKG